jgi:hypothetical protein
MGNPIPEDTSCEAEYADGYIHNETLHNDVSPYNPEQNILRDILEKRPEAEHGKLVRFSVFYKDRRYDVDWRGLPDNARPIRFRNGNRSINMGTGEQDFWWSGIRFGYQWNDETGKNHKEVREL